MGSSPAKFASFPRISLPMTQSDSDFGSFGSFFVGSAAKPEMAPPPWSLWSRPTASMQMGHQLAQAPSQPSPPFRAFHLGVLGTHFPLSALLLLFARAIFGVGHMTRFTEYEIGDCLVPHLFRTDRVHTWMVRLWSVAVRRLLFYFSSSHSVPMFMSQSCRV